MNISKLKDTQIAVYKLLMKYPHLRENDQRLVASYHNFEMGGVTVCKSITAFDYLQLIIEGKLTNGETITRARRKVQEKYPETRGANYEQRKSAENEIRETIKNV